jgi:hypothetical protein
MWDRRDFLVQKHTEHKERVKTVTNIVNGEWYVEWPDLSQTPEAPTVANLVEMGINHWAAVGGAVLPSIHIPVNVASDRSQARRGARKRERRVRELWEKSNVSELAALLWGDYAGSGCALLGAWADFSTPEAERNPYLVRFDPRHTYPLRDDLGNITELLVARNISKEELATMLSAEEAAMFKDTNDEEVEEWFWYTADSFQHVIADISKDARSVNRCVILVDEPNELGFVPVAECVRPSFDGQRRGVFDQTVHLLRTMHRFMSMTLYSTMEHSFPAVLEFDVVNPGDFGPGATMHARSAEARLERIQPAAHFDVKDLIARLGEEARQQATWPQQLHGEPGGTIVSARGVNASMGALDARLALAHKQMERLFGAASGFLLAVDEIYCSGEKTITGDRRDTRKAEAFNPERDIAGAWEVGCTYGIGSGSDPSNIEVRLNMHLASGLISRTTARHQLPFLDDPDAEDILITRELAQQALLTGVLAMAGQGQMEPALKLLQLLHKDDVDFETVLEQMVEFMSQPPPQEAAAPGMPGMEGGALGALQGAESLARGGVPGEAPQAPPSTGMGLPPLGEMLGGPRQTI